MHDLPASAESEAPARSVWSNTVDEYDVERRYWAENLSSRLDDASFSRMAETVMEDDAVRDGIGLELGCGEGRLLELLPNAVGADYSILGLRQNRNVRDSVVCADAMTLPFADNSFDYVITNSLHHMSYRETLSEVGRVLKPGGVFHCFEPNRWHVYNLLFNRQGGDRIVGDRGFFCHALNAELRLRGMSATTTRFFVLNMERIRLLTRVQRMAQKIPSRFFQAWSYTSAIAR